MHQQQAYNLYCQQLCKFYWQMVYCQIYQIAVSAVSPCDYKKALPKEQNRLTRLDYPDGNFISYEYDLNGNRTLLTTANQVVAYTYDALNRSSTVTDSNGITTYTYDNVGNRATQANANGTKATYSYDNLNRLLDFTHRDASNNVIASYVYTLGANGNRTRIEEATGRIVDYTYDDLYRLITEDITDPVNGNHSSEFAYDSVGNRLQQTKDGVTTTYIYNNNDHLLSETENGITTTYVYDNNGNTLSKTIGATLDTSYSYNKDNRMVQAITLTSTIINTYDAGGIRQAQTVDGITTNYLVDQNRSYAQVLEEQNNLFIPQITYVYGDDLISQTQGGATHTFGYDGLGSTRILTDVAGTVQNVYGYEAFGEVDYQLGTVPNNYLFTGEQYDNNVGFYYLRARFYNPSNGRFVNMDTFAGMQFEPITLHKYLYANGNPSNIIDPSGNFGIGGLMAGIAGAATLALSGVSIYSGIVNISDGNLARGAIEIGLGFMGTGIFTGAIRLLKFAKGPVNIAIRAKYVSSLNQMATLLPKLRAAGKSSEAIARQFVNMRNAIKIEQRAKMIAEGGLVGKAMVKGLELANFIRYRNKVGPTAERLFKKYGDDWEEVINAAQRANPSVNSFLGVL